MPQQWEASIYDYESKAIAHPQIADLDVEHGKWFQCKVCRNPRSSEGRFDCRTPFSSESIISARAGHMSKKSHVDRMNAASAGSKSSGLMSFLQVKQELSPKEAPNSELTQPPTLLVEGLTLVPIEATECAASPAKKIECQGLGWELADDLAWINLYEAYLTYAEA